MMEVDSVVASLFVSISVSLTATTATVLPIASMPAAAEASSVSTIVSVAAAKSSTVRVPYGPVVAVNIPWLGVTETTLTPAGA